MMASHEVPAPVNGPPTSIIVIDASRPNQGVPVTGSDLRAATKAVLAGQSLPPEQAPSIGCNIKWNPGNESKSIDPVALS